MCLKIKHSETVDSLEVYKVLIKRGGKLYAPFMNNRFVGSVSKFGINKDEITTGLHSYLKLENAILLYWFLMEQGDVPVIYKAITRGLVYYGDHDEVASLNLKLIAEVEPKFIESLKTI